MATTSSFPFMFDAAECLVLFSKQLPKLQHSIIDYESNGPLSCILCIDRYQSECSGYVVGQAMVMKCFSRSL